MLHIFEMGETFLYRVAPRRQGGRLPRLSPGCSLSRSRFFPEAWPSLNAVRELDKIKELQAARPGEEVGF